MLITIGTQAVRSQGIPDYYRPPDIRQDGTNYITDRWYVGLEGQFRINKNQLDQNFKGLIRTEAVTKANWGATLGWVGAERWAFEAGYARSPIHNSLVIGNDAAPVRLKFTNDKNGLVLRMKRLMHFGRKPIPNSGLWLGAGFWLVPNTGKEVSQMAFLGYSSRGRRSRSDTLRLRTDTRINPGLTGQLEASAEYRVRLGRLADLGFFLRKNWGLGASLTTRIRYEVNSGSPAVATLRGDGSGWGLGMALRYVYNARYTWRTRSVYRHN